MLQSGNVYSQFTEVGLGVGGAVYYGDLTLDNAVDNIKLVRPNVGVFISHHFDNRWAVLAGLLGLPTELAAALGYCAVFGTATNTLLAPIFIGYEVFGSSIIQYAIPVLIIAYFVNRKQTIYGMQMK